VTAGTRLKSKEIFGSLDATWNEWFPPAAETPEKEQEPESLPDSIQSRLPNSQNEISEVENNTIERGGRRTVKRSDNKSSQFSFSINPIPYLKDHLNDISLSFGTGRSSELVNGESLDQADIAYQLAFSRIPTNFREGDMSWSGNYNWEIGTSLNLMKNVNITNIKYRFNRSYKDDNKSLNGDDDETQFVIPLLVDHLKTDIFDDACLPLPDYSISYSGLRELLKVEEIFKALDLSHSKSSNRTASWYLTSSRDYTLNNLNIPDFDQENGMICKTSSKKYKLSFSPLIGINMTFKNDISLNTEMIYDFLMDESYDPKSTLASSGSKKETQSFKTTGSYNQTGGFQTPFNFWPFNGRKLSNDIKYSLSLSYSQSRNYVLDNKIKAGKPQYQAEGDGTETETYAFAPGITYNLSKNINGSFNYTYNKNYKKDIEGNKEISSNQTMELKFTMTIASK